MLPIPRAKWIVRLLRFAVTLYPPAYIVVDGELGIGMLTGRSRQQGVEVIFLSRFKVLMQSPCLEGGIIHASTRFGTRRQSNAPMLVVRKAVNSQDRTTHLALKP